MGRVASDPHPRRKGVISLVRGADWGLPIHWTRQDFNETHHLLVKEAG